MYPISIQGFTGKHYVYIGLFCISVALAALGHPLTAAYFALNYIVFAVLVSVLIEGWKSSGAVLVESREQPFTTYINGLRVDENQHRLINLHFISEKSMQLRYSALLLIKLAIPLGLIYAYINELQQTPFSVTLLSVSAGAFTLIFLTIRAYTSARALIVALGKNWKLNTSTIQEREYGAAYIRNSQGYTPFLHEVFR